MNRYDEIKGAALDVAQHVTQDPKQRDAMACDLITLVGLMLGAVGKGVSVDGESGIRHCNDPECDCAVNGCDRDADMAHTRYLTGEAIQTQADDVAGQSRTADLSRYATQVWHPRCARCAERGGHDKTCDALCTECDRVLQFGHLVGCSRREPLPSRVVLTTDPRCGVTADGPACDWDMNCPEHGDWFGR